MRTSMPWRTNLEQIWNYAPVLDYDDSIGDFIEETNPGLVLWYRGRPGKFSERQI